MDKEIVDRFAAIEKSIQGVVSSIADIVKAAPASDPAEPKTPTEPDGDVAKLQSDNDALSKRIVKLEGERELATHAEIARTVYPNVPGDPAQIGALLRSAAQWPEEQPYWWKPVRA